MKTLQPAIVINNRLDLGPGNSDRQILSPHADYYTPEQLVGAYDDQRPWESCMTTSRKGQWAWGGREDGVKSLDECLGMLIRCAGGDGNMLLNVGPMPTGEIAPEQAKVLQEMGVWLAKYGESIYGTRGGPFKPGDFGVSTRKGNTIYLHLCEWTEEMVTLPAISRKVVRSRVLGGGKAEVRQTAAGMQVSVPAKRPPADRHHRRTRTGWLRARTVGGRRARAGVADGERQSDRLEHLPEAGGVWSGQGRRRPQRYALGNRQRCDVRLAGAGSGQAGDVQPRAWSSRPIPS